MKEAGGTPAVHMDEANAKLLRVDVGRATGVGSTVWAQGAAVSIDCYIDVVTNQQRYLLGAKIKDATAVLFVEHRDCDAATLEALLDEATERRTFVQAYGRHEKLWDLVAMRDLVDEDLGHLEVFLKAAEAAA